MPDFTPKPRFARADLCGFTAEQDSEASAWIKLKADTGNEFAQSLRLDLATKGGLTARQWKAAVDSAAGRRSFRRKRRNTAVTASAPAADTPAATPSAPAEPSQAVTNDRSMKLPATKRDAIRKAIVRHDGWKAYAAAKGINSGKLDRNAIFDAADALGVDLAKVIADDTAAKRADLDAAAAALGKVGGEVDWSRVRRIAKEEVEERLNPVIRNVLVIDQGGTKVTAPDDELTHPAFDLFAAAACSVDGSGAYNSVYLNGPAGTGKSYAAYQLGRMLKLDVYVQSIALEPHDLLGYERLNGELKVMPFVRAFRDGGICLLDELDRWSAKAVIALNAALANGRLALDSGEQIERHPDFRCVGTGNTSGLGASTDFNTAEKLDLSTLSRFAVRIDWQAVPEFEVKLAERIGDAIGKAWCMEVQHIREVMARLDLPRLADQRCIEAGIGLLKQGLSPDTVRDLTYRALLDSDQRQAVSDIAEDVRLVKG